MFNYLAVPKFEFNPPSAMSEMDFEIAKGLQDEGNRKLNYLHTQPLKPYLKIIGLVYAGLGVLWLLFWALIHYLPTPGEKDVLAVTEWLFLIISFGVLFFVWNRLWQFFTCLNYNWKLHRMIKKSKTYQEFRQKHYKTYGK